MQSNYVKSDKFNYVPFTNVFVGVKMWSPNYTKFDVIIDIGYLLLLLVIFQVKIDRTLVAIEIYMTKQLKLEL